MIASVVAFAGIRYNFPILTNISSAWVSIRAITSACLFLSGLGLLLINIKEPGLFTKIIIITISIILLVISSMTIFEYITGIDPVFDRFLVQQNMLHFDPYPGRMSYFSAFNFILISVAYLLSLRKSVPAWKIQIIALMIFIFSLISLNNYIFNVDLQNGLAIYITMSMVTVILFMLISLGIVLLKPDSGIIEILRRKSTSSYFLRRMLPIILLVPMFLAIAENKLAMANLIEGNLGDSLYTTSTFVILATIVILITRTIDREEKNLEEAKKIISRNDIIFREFAKNIDIVFYTTSLDLNTVLYVSPAYERIWGRSSESLYKNPLEWYESILPEDKNLVYQEFFVGMQNEHLTGSAEYRIKRPDGSIRNIFSRAFKVKDESQNVFSIIGIAVDMTDIKLDKIYRQIQFDIIRIMETEKTIDSFAPKIIKVICNALNWDLGEIWLIDEPRNILRCVNIWHKEIEKLTNYDIESRKYIFNYDEGLPGRIWKEKRPVWISDYTHGFSRSDDAAKAGLNSAFGIPLIFQDKVFGIMEFFSFSIQPPDPELLVMAGNIGKTIGEFVQRVYDYKQIQSISHQDILTGLLNRSTLEENLDQLITSGKLDTIAILILDIDRFKLINEALGHDQGDYLLKSVSIRLTDMIDREITHTARLGSDKFIIFFPITNKNDALNSARMIKQGFDKPFDIDQNEIALTVSIGMAIYPQNGINSKELITNADLAMMHAKDMGGNRIEFFMHTYPFIASKKLTLQMDIRHAIANNEFFLVYQPQIDLKTGNICAAEALVRWQHPDKGLIYPGSFISYAEQIGLIVPLNEHILYMAFQQIDSNWPGPPVSLNISAQQFKDGFHIVEYLESLLQEFRVNPKSIELEITEGTLMEDTEHNIAVISALHELGFQIAIDDFGTGFSSFSYLNHLPVQKIKIDRAFISGLPGNLANAKIVKAMIPLIHSLDMIVVAEGAEQQAEIEFLSHEKCDIVQGYYYYKPMSFSDYLIVMAKTSVNKIPH